jgi:hypothetical protein
MYDINELIAALRTQSTPDITRMLSMTWYHQIKARERIPEIMDRREELMALWLTEFDLMDAAAMIQLIEAHGLKDGNLPEGYDPEHAQGIYERMVRQQDESAYMRALRAFGMHDQRNEGLGREIKLRT